MCEDVEGRVGRLSGENVEWFARCTHYRSGIFNGVLRYFSFALGIVTIQRRGRLKDCSKVYSGVIVSNRSLHRLVKPGRNETDIRQTEVYRVLFWSESDSNVVSICRSILLLLLLRSVLKSLHNTKPFLWQNPTTSSTESLQHLIVYYCFYGRYAK